MSDHSNESDEDEQPAAPGTLLQHLLAEDDDSDDDDTAAPVATETAASVPEAGESSAGALPSASDLLLGSAAKPDFLRVEALQPEFDASKHFKPPAVTHADLMCASDRPRGEMARSLEDEAPGQRYHQEENFGRAQGQVRMRGSMCFETDDERGRRVVYGAHQMLKADPWSACNPNKPLRSFASGKKRKNGDT